MSGPVHICKNTSSGLLSSGKVPALQEKPLRSPQRVTGAELPLGMQRPKQSYEFLGVKEVHVQRDACVVMAQRLKGVARWAAFSDTHGNVIMALVCHHQAECVAHHASSSMLQHVCPRMCHHAGVAPRPFAFLVCSSDAVAHQPPCN